jgi:hypothetical protein
VLASSSRCHTLSVSTSLFDCQVGKISTELELKDQKAQNELSRIEYERERRKVIKEVRSEAHALSAARRKKAEDYRKKQASFSLPLSHLPLTHCL